MNLRSFGLLLATVVSVLIVSAACQSGRLELEQDATNANNPPSEQTASEQTASEQAASEQAASEQAASEPTTVAAESMSDAMSSSESSFMPLPERSGPRTETTGSVPHVQLDVDLVQAVNDELYRRTFALPDVVKRPTMASLPGADGMWLSDGAPVVRPDVIVAGREFAHIHPDGSLHAPLPFERALEAVEKGWAERHPWAEQRDGFEGFVMLFTPQSMDELDVTFQLIVDSYNHVTGRTVQASDFTN